MEIPKNIERLRNYMEYKKYAPRSIQAYCDNLERALKVFDGIYSEPVKIPSSKWVAFLSDKTEVNTHKAYLSPLKMFYEKVLKQYHKFDGVEYPRKKEMHVELPLIEEVKRMIDVCDNIKHRCIIKVFIACGLRISELLDMKYEHIDKDLGTLSVVGKGNKFRTVKVPENLLIEIDEYVSKHKPKDYLFEGQNGGKYSETSIRNFLNDYAELAGIKTHIHPHKLRHFYGSYCLELGVQQRVLQAMMGHNSPKTLQIYTHIRRESVATQITPLSMF